MKERDVNLKLMMILNWVIVAISIAIIIVANTVSDMFMLTYVGLLFPALFRVIIKIFSIIGDESSGFVQKFLSIALYLLVNVFIALPMCIYNAIKYTVLVIKDSKR